MKHIFEVSCILIFFACGSFGWAFTAGAGAAAAAGAAFFAKKLYCVLTECCTDRWISRNFSGLNADLKENVFGQHLATDVVYKAIKGHVENPNPSKALVLSFHGWTGSGKNFISGIIAKNLYKKGMESKYTHQIIATHDFPHNDRLKEYQSKLREFVAEKVKLCPNSLFIFDEVDKIPGGLIDSIKPFLEYYKEVGGVDYRKCIFIFISNTGANIINEVVFKHWRQGNKREDLGLKDFEPVINKGAFNLVGGLWHSQLILHNLIDHFVPFLPLEKSHIRKCIRADLKFKNKANSPDIVSEIANLLLYHDPEKVFSVTGCKKVPSKVDLIV